MDIHLYKLKEKYPYKSKKKRIYKKWLKKNIVCKAVYKEVTIDSVTNVFKNKEDATDKSHYEVNVNINCTF